MTSAGYKTEQEVQLSLKRVTESVALGHSFQRETRSENPLFCDYERNLWFLKGLHEYLSAVGTKSQTFACDARWDV